MSKMSNLSLEISDMLEAGYLPVTIARMLEVPINWVYETAEADAQDSALFKPSTPEEQDMDYFSDLEYDIQEMYIDGLAPDEIAYRLKVDIERVIVLLTRFGVDVSDYGTEPV